MAYSASQECYCHPHDIAELARCLEAFPRNATDEVRFSAGSKDAGWAHWVSLRFFLYDRAGHAGVSVDVGSHNVEPYRQEARFTIRCEVSSLNRIDGTQLAIVLGIAVACACPWSATEGAHDLPRTGRAQRRPHMRIERSGAGRLQSMILISDRPPEIEDRAVTGHWEGDLIIGKGGRSAIGVLVERSSRYVVLLHLPHGRTAEDVRAALTRQVSKLPAELRRPLTWDQGKDMADHVRFSTDTNMAVYFCDPHSPWHRGSNENTNGLLRQYFPSKADLSTESQKRRRSHGIDSTAVRAITDVLASAPEIRELTWDTSP
jgi:integrase-like protein